MRSFLRLIIVLFLLPFVSHCATNTIDQAVPLASQQQISNNGTLAANPLPAPKNTGQYPNINAIPTAEVSQLSDSQTAAKRAELEGEALAQRQSGESAEGYVERLRKLQQLGSTHAANVLRQIEKSK